MANEICLKDNNTPPEDSSVPVDSSDSDNNYSNSLSLQTDSTPVCVTVNPALQASFSDNSNSLLQPETTTSKAGVLVEKTDFDRQDSLKLFLEDSEHPDDSCKEGTDDLQRLVLEDTEVPELSSKSKSQELLPSIETENNLKASSLTRSQTPSMTVESLNDNIFPKAIDISCSKNELLESNLINEADNSLTGSNEACLSTKTTCSDTKHLEYNLSGQDEANNSDMDSDEEPLFRKVASKKIRPLDKNLSDEEVDETDNTSRDVDHAQVSSKVTSSRNEPSETNMSDDEQDKEDNLDSNENSTSKDTKKPVKETAKRRKELEMELQNIHSETQRLSRETAVSLPYHKPQITSLTDFLNRRSFSKISTPANAKLSLSIKPSTGLKSSTINEKPYSCTKLNNKTPVISEFKKKLLQGSNFANVTPTLGKQTEFDLGETPKGLTNLMTRFFKHNHKTVEPTVQDVKLHLVCKDVDKDGQENLKAQEITVKLEPEEKGTALNTEKFSFYKDQLLSSITKKKLKKQEELVASYELDNEEGFEEEEEIGSDIDSDENQIEEDGSESELEEGLDLKPKSKSDINHGTLLEDVACEAKDAEIGTLILEDSELPGSKTDSGVEGSEEQDLILEDSETADCRKSQEDMDSSFELMGSIFPAQQPGGGLKYGGCEVSDDEIGSQKTPIRCNTVFGRKSSDYESEIDSPVISIPKLPMSFNKSDLTDSQGYNDLLPLCSGRFTSPNDCSLGKSQVSIFGKSAYSLKKALFANNDSSHSQNVDELLAICSGKFNDSTQVKRIDNSQQDPTNSEDFLMSSNVDGQPSASVLSAENDTNSNSKCPDTIESKQPEISPLNESDSEDDVIHISRRKVASKRKVKLNLDSDDEESESTANNKQKMTYSDDDNDSDEEANDINGDDDDSDNNEGANGINEDDDDSDNNEEANEDDDITPDKKLSEEVAGPAKVTDFFDEEAELSGSDVGSDDEGDEDENEQIFDDTVPSDEEMTEEDLRNQVGRVHLKQVMDDDKRELRFFQEVYLEDGDLHTDGNGRERKFRWQNAEHGESGDQGNEEEGSGDEIEGTGPENEKWRVQRHEREKWLQEQEALHSIENWTGFKLVKRSKPVFNSQPNASVSQSSSPFTTGLPKSFLARNKDFCSQLAEKIQKQNSEHVGRRSTKNFVFVSKKSPTKAVKRAAEPVIVKEAKIRKLTTIATKVTTSVKKSVFNFI